MDNFKENFWGQKLQVVLLWNLSFPRSAGRYAKNSEGSWRNQFEQQWFDVISFQKPRRVYPAIWYNLKPFAHKKGRFTLSTPAKCTSHVSLSNPWSAVCSPQSTFYTDRFVKGQSAIINQIIFKNHNVFASRNWILPNRTIPMSVWFIP